MQLLREVEYQIRLVMIGLVGIDVVGLAYGNVGRSIGKWEYRDDDAVVATAAGIQVDSTYYRYLALASGRRLEGIHHARCCEDGSALGKVKKRGEKKGGKRSSL